MFLKVNAVIFDMDGVITDTMPYHFEVWQQLFGREGLSVTKHDIYRREGQKGIESVQEVFLQYGKTCAIAQAQRLLEEKERRFKEIFKCRFIAGARPFLRRLHGGGFKLALVTGTSRAEAVKILPAGLFDRFNVTVCGCDVNNGKPLPEPYLQALRKLSVASSEGVFL